MEKSLLHYPSGRGPSLPAVAAHHCQPELVVPAPAVVDHRPDRGGGRPGPSGHHDLRLEKDDVVPDPAAAVPLPGRATDAAGTGADGADGQDRKYALQYRRTT